MSFQRRFAPLPSFRPMSMAVRVHCLQPTFLHSAMRLRRPSGPPCHAYGWASDGWHNGQNNSRATRSDISYRIYDQLENYWSHVDPKSPHQASKRCSLRGMPDQHPAFRLLERMRIARTNRPYRSVPPCCTVESTEFPSRSLHSFPRGSDLR
jgi:hypothetical protein